MPYGSCSDGQGFSYTVNINHPEIVSRAILHAGCMDNGIYIYIDGNQVFYTWHPEDSNYCEFVQDIDITPYVKNHETITVSGYHLVSKEGGGYFTVEIQYQ